MLRPRFFLAVAVLADGFDALGGVTSSPSDLTANPLILLKWYYLHEAKLLSLFKGLVSVRRLLESFESLGFYGAHLDSRRGLQCGQTRTGRSTTAIT